MPKAAWRPESGTGSLASGALAGLPEAKKSKSQDTRGEGEQALAVLERADVARVRRRRGGEFKNYTKPKAVDQSLHQLLKVLITQTMINTKHLRELRGALITTVALPAEHEIVKALKEESKRYAAAIREAGKGHSLGPPCIGLMAALAEAMGGMDVGLASRTALKEMAEKFAEMQVQKMADLVQVCRIESSFKEEKVKLVFMIRSTQYREQLMRALEHLGFKAFAGSPPAGYLEDELTMWLEALKI